MAQSIERACRRYREAMRARASRRWDRDTGIQVEHYRRQMERIRTVDAKVKSIVLEMEQNYARVTLYLNFGRRLAALKRRYSRRTLGYEAGTALELWQAKGADQRVLEMICRAVLGETR